jgi:DNA-binding beta-propeller fold protein YncE
MGGIDMKRFRVVLLALVIAWPVKSPAQEKTPLRPLEAIPIPNAARYQDHFGLDLKSHRVFSASEDEPVVDVFDLRTNKHIHTIKGFKKPHNVLALPEMNKIYVVDGEASEIKVLDYKSYSLIGHITLTIDADPIAYDSAKKLLYVVNGGREAHTPYCLISVVDTRSDKKLADMKIVQKDTNRLESMALEKSGSRLFVNMTGNNEIGVVDREKRALVQTWSITAGKENVPMQLDEANHRLFVVTRTPPKLVVLDTETGKEITSVPVGEGVDDLSYDPKQHRLYVPAREGILTVVQQRGADDYQVIANIPTKRGAKTGRFFPEVNRFYLGVPSLASGSKGYAAQWPTQRLDQDAQVLVYEVVP